MQRREFLTKLSGLAAAGLAAGLVSPSLVFGEEKKKKMNVLFIAVDDLRPQLGCYGQTQMITPNLDKLAADGALFTRTYCQQAVCSPSRTSLPTGLRPDTTKIYDLETHFRDTIPDVVTLPQHFKNNGYHSVGIGKIYHGGLDDAASWSEPWIRAQGRNYALEENFEKLFQGQPKPAPMSANPTAAERR
ncbi:MAG: iduronate-2-sulfatase, partial [Syntrophobacterales bacterium]